MKRQSQHAQGSYHAGTIRRVATWSAILTDDQIATLAAGVSPASIRPDALVRSEPPAAGA